MNANTNANIGANINTEMLHGKPAFKQARMDYTKITTIDEFADLDVGEDNNDEAIRDSRIASTNVNPNIDVEQQKIIECLNEALANKVISVMRYRRHYFMAQGLAADAIKKEFLLHAEQEQAHADRIAKRIIELGGEPSFGACDLTSRAHTEYAAGKDLESMIKVDLLAEHVAVNSVREMAAHLAKRDPVSGQLLTEILTTEIEQAEELSSMLGDLQCLLSLWRTPSVK